MTAFIRSLFRRPLTVGQALVLSLALNAALFYVALAAVLLQSRDMTDDEVLTRARLIEQKSQHLEQLRRQLTAPPPKPCAANDLNCITKGE